MGAISGAQAIKGMSSVTVVNLGEKPLTSVRLLLAGKVIPLKDVPPGGTVTRSFVVNRSGDIYIEGMQGADKVSGSVGRASNEAMKLTLTLDSGGEFHVVSNAVPGEN
jgi:hypothetical protein